MPLPLTRIAFIGGYEPRRCGIATFTHHICEAVANISPAAECIAGAVNDKIEGYKYPSRVRFELLEKDLDSYRRAADFLNFNRTEVLSLQHEFGIYGGTAGSHILALLREIKIPVVTTLHTVLQQPNAPQRQVMERLIYHSERLVVMAHKGAEILQDTYRVPEGKIDIIPHGIPETQFSISDAFKGQFGLEGRKVLLTFGLLGPGKGIEYAIKALPEIVRHHPDVVYVVLGATHPHLVMREGENYRLGLERLAEENGVKGHVIFFNRFASAAELTEFIGATDIYVTPYLNEAQITSGTLAYVFGAGKAVVSTPYWHASELLASGRGTLVPFRDSQAIAAAVCGLLDDPVLHAKIEANAYVLGRTMIWPAVARSYVEVFQQAVADSSASTRAVKTERERGAIPYSLPLLRLDHIVRMSDGTGIFQHAIYNVPNFHEGYCTDDNARAFILCNLIEEPSSIHHLETSYLAFLAAAFNDDTGRFRNFMSHGRQWLEVHGSEDSHARALWALGVGVGHSKNPGHRMLSRQLFERGLAAVHLFTSPRSWAFSLLGIHEYLQEFPAQADIQIAREVLTDRLVKLWQNHATTDWPWFECSVTYDNARLCQALMISGRKMQRSDAAEIASTSLRWIVATQVTSAGHFRPIGSDGFYHKEGACARFDQQPIEAQAMVAACLEAYHTTHEPFWLIEAKRAFEWFLGRNDLGLPLYDSATGGCGDGLHHDRVNANQGAESSLAFHLALADMNLAEHLGHQSKNMNL